MSTTASMSSEVKLRKCEQKIRRIASKRLSKLQMAEKDEAKNAALNTADLFVRGWRPSSFSLPDSMAASYDNGASSDCASSKASTGKEAGVETAVKRGLNRGSSERNERSNVSGGIFRDDASDFDLTTITEDVLTNTTGETPSTKNGRKRRRGKKKVKSLELERLSKELAHDAWMCGVCGKAFASLEAADKHEEQHIRDVVAGLGWAGENNILNSSFLAAWSHVPSCGDSLAPRISRRTSDDHRVTFESDNPQQKDRYDFSRSSDATEGTFAFNNRAIHRMNSAPGALNGAMVDPLLGCECEDQDESLLLSNTMKQAIVLADEALVTVCERAEGMILSQAERDAERELKFLANDKAYYDLIAERTLTRRRNPASRFRSEGKTILSKVQNKFVDAYQLIKEGDPQGMTSDQYNRKRTGQDDTDHVISHNDKTLYVNVMVKNSIQVVSHELERLAKQRWEDAHQVGGSRFERFRALAHGNFGMYTLI